jgi:hypothetical protein
VNAIRGMKLGFSSSTSSSSSPLHIDHHRRRIIRARIKDDHNAIDPAGADLGLPSPADPQVKRNQIFYNNNNHTPHASRDRRFDRSENFTCSVNYR